jgi:hypothetical protein
VPVAGQNMQECVRSEKIICKDAFRDAMTAGVSVRTTMPSTTGNVHDG